MTKIGVVTLVGGRGGRLQVITGNQPKPAVKIVGKYRLIDFVMTNIARTNALKNITGYPYELEEVIVAMQYRSQQLVKHIGEGKEWGFGTDNPLETRVITFEMPHESNMGQVWFEGTADAARKCLPHMVESQWTDVLILAGDHLYTGDYSGFTANHFKTNADFSIGIVPVEEYQIGGLGIVKIDNLGRIVSFYEKAQKGKDDDIIEEYRIPEKIRQEFGIDKRFTHFGSMGIYFSSVKNLEAYLSFPGDDFGKEIIPKMHADGKVLMSYIYKGSWYDVGKIEDLIYIQLQMAQQTAPKDIMEAFIITKERQTRASSINPDSQVSGVIFGGGVKVGPYSKIKDCILGRDITIGSGTEINTSIFNGEPWEKGLDYSNLSIGDNCSLKKVYANEGVKIGNNVRIGVDNLDINGIYNAFENARFEPYDETKKAGDFYIVEQGPVKGFVALRSGLVIPNGFRA